MPLLIAPRIGATALKLSYVSFPFGLAREGREACHVTVEIEVIDGVHYHEKITAFAVYLHIEDAYSTLTFNDFGPDVFMDLNVF